MGYFWRQEAAADSDGGRGSIGRGSIEPPTPHSFKMSLSWKILGTSDKYRIQHLLIPLPHIQTPYSIRLFNKSSLLPMNEYKIARCVANSKDPDHMPSSVASILGLHFWLRFTLRRLSNQI